ncbi:MAG TPA: hypothetical protein VGF17_23950 [Phytomonospora sp.]
MPESAEEIVFRHARERLHERLTGHPDPLVREVALEVLKGTYTWSEAMNSAVYGPAIDAMAEGGERAGGPPRDLLAEATELTARMVAEVREHGEIALDDGRF